MVSNSLLKNEDEGIPQDDSLQVFGAAPRSSIYDGGVAASPLYCGELFVGYCPGNSVED